MSFISIGEGGSGAFLFRKEHHYSIPVSPLLHMDSCFHYSVLCVNASNSILTSSLRTTRGRSEMGSGRKWVHPSPGATRIISH